MSTHAPAMSKPAAKPVAKPMLSPARAPLLQRKCACGGSTGADGKCAACAAKEAEKKQKETAPKSGAVLQRKPSTGGAAAPVVPSIVHGVVASPGRPLDAATRSYMEPRFGQDFSHVRVHDDARAAESARAVNAKAYAMGSSVVFDKGEYQPHTSAGRYLLAHELAHTVQQQGTMQRSSREATIDSPGSSLETEADSAARAVTSGPSATAVMGRAAAPVLSRARNDAPGESITESGSATSEDLAWKKVNSGALSDLGVKRESSVFKNAKGKKQQAFEVGKFTLPPEKGPVLAHWKAKAEAGGLVAIVDAAGGEASLWQHREPTKELKDRWLAKVGWQSGNPSKLWKAAGGDASSGDFVPKVNSVTCQMDHIIELQIGGNNTSENVQALDAVDNQTSGGTIWQQLKSLAANIRAERTDITDVALHFQSVIQPGVKSPGGCAKSGEAKSCKQVEKCAISQGGKPDKEDAAAAKGTEAERVPYKIVAGGSPTTLMVPPLGKAGKGKGAKGGDDTFNIHDADDAQTKAAADLVPGLVLQVLHRKSKGNDVIDACINSGKCLGSSTKTRLPISLDGQKGKVVLNVEAGGVLKLQTHTVNLDYTYPYLSKGVIKKLNYDATTGLSGEGTLTPSVPLLNRMVFTVSFSGDEFKITSGFDPKKITPPFPGFTITKSELSLILSPTLSASGEVAFAIAPKEKPVLEGSVVASVDASGFVLTGHLSARVPGLDEAKGDISYRDHKWAGGFDIKATPKPPVTGVSVHVGFDDKGEITPSGGVSLALPGGNTATLDVHRDKSGRWIFSGKGKAEIPPLNPIDFDLIYDGTSLKGTGHTAINVHGLDGNLTAHYADGKVFGEGKLDVKKGRANGSIDIALHQSGKYSGKGKISYQLTENLIAEAGIEVPENGPVRLVGSLEFPKPIKLFDGFHGQMEVFKAAIKIPIPGASIGLVGLVVQIDGALSANYGIGPGTLEGTKLAGALNPLEDKPDVDVELATTLRVPAHAGIAGSVRGALAIDATLASVSGGLTVTASADLNGGAEAKLDVHYRKGNFTLDATAAIDLALVLGLKLDADVNARAGFGRFSVETGKVWHLAGYQYDTGLKFGMKAPLHYDSSQPFKAPSLDQIEWTVPKINPGDMLQKVFAGSPGKETSK